MHFIAIIKIIILGGKNDCRDDDIRLTGSQNEREGVVEICFQGVWGTMCSDYLTYVDYYLSIEGDTRADVICRQLGFLEPNTSESVYRRRVKPKRIRMNSIL